MWFDWLTLSSSCSIPNMRIYQKSFRSSYYLARWPENVPFSKFLHFTRIRIRHIEYGIESVWAPHSFWFSSKKIFYLIFSLYFSTFKFISNFLNKFLNSRIFGDIPFLGSFINLKHLNYGILEIVHTETQ